MSLVPSECQFADADISQIDGLRIKNFELKVRQQPKIAKVASGKDRERKPIDPPPIVQLKVNPSFDPNQTFLQNPYMFVMCSLVGALDDNLPPVGELGTCLAGTNTSSMHQIRDSTYGDGGFFVFSDLSVRTEGSFRLKFSLFVCSGDYAWHLTDTESTPFHVFSAKDFPGMEESTSLTRSFSDQGVRVRLRKDPRSRRKKRGPAHDNYEPRHYRQHLPSVNHDPGIQEGGFGHSRNHRRPTTCHGDAVDLHQKISQEAYLYQQSMGRDSFEDSSKRLRTGSDADKLPSFCQQHLTWESTSTMQTEPHAIYQDYGQHSQQPETYAHCFAKSQGLSHPNITGEQYLIQGGNLSESTSYDMQTQRSPSISYFPAHAQAIPVAPFSAHQQDHYANPVLENLSPQSVNTALTNFEDLGLTGRVPTSVINGVEMADLMSPVQGSLDTSYATIPVISSTRQDSYYPYSS